MSESDFNNYELQACRRFLCLDVSEAAELIGKVSARTWRYWEAGRSKVPEDVKVAILELIADRNIMIDALKGNECVNWYHSFSDFEKNNSNSGRIEWRVHQSACIELFTSGRIKNLVSG